MLSKYEQIENVLARIESPYSPEDCHGMLCAMLIVNNSLRCNRWLDEICTLTQNDQLNVLEERDILQQLYDHTRQELNDALLDFSLLIPENVNELSRRVAALKKWCEGFLFGLALAGVKDMSQLPEDSFEVLQDIVTISQASEDDEEDEMNEVAYNDILEYVRVGILLMNEELQPMNSSVTIQ